MLFYLPCVVVNWSLGKGRAVSYEGGFNESELYRIAVETVKTSINIADISIQVPVTALVPSSISGLSAQVYISMPIFAYGTTSQAWMY